ncbi:hypothetical protein [Methylobacterium aquaticum]|uniref:hypothetical protein n=1 Tax=Methylobacterium aquaticum TaxID=270351 RepID=UPI00193403D5|nr:hypothetical protein [Methylobacterium aquaticum]
MNFFILHLAPGDAAQVLAGESGLATRSRRPLGLMWSRLAMSLMMRARSIERLGAVGAGRISAWRYWHSVDVASSRFKGASTGP